MTDRAGELCQTYQVPKLAEKIRLYILALIQAPLYRFGELGNILYTVGKNMMEGVVLYTMFTMAENELKVAAMLAVTVKFTYPGISVISSNYTSGFIDHLESSLSSALQIPRLIKAHIGIGCGQALGGIFLFFCYPPVFTLLFNGLSWCNYLLVALYFLHHVFDGSAQIIEGRTWFKINEISLRNGSRSVLSDNFWVIYALSQNVQLLLGQFFLWGTLLLTSFYVNQLSSIPIMTAVLLGLVLVVISKFILPLAYYHDLKDLRKNRY